MGANRHRLQFSLRILFVALTAFSLWVGISVKLAREQQANVTAIEELGGSVRYDWQTDAEIWGDLGEKKYRHRFNSKSSSPAWVHDLLQKVREVYFFDPQSAGDNKVRDSIPYLQRLSGLKRVNVMFAISVDTENELRKALPHCKWD